MKIVIDMNLTPAWVPFLESQGLEAVHWTQVGDNRATDYEIMQWARNNNSIVFTHDLDFGAILSATQAQGPSVIQVRGQNVLPASLGTLVARTLVQYKEELIAGALITIEPARSRIRLLPLITD
jgi:predicted nuclease of predicted toxin-antitoxin system